MERQDQNKDRKTDFHGNFSRYIACNLHIFINVHHIRVYFFRIIMSVKQCKRFKIAEPALVAYSFVMSR